MTTLYRPVRVLNDAQRAALPKGSFMHPNCYMGGILTYLVPIEAEEETREHPTRVEERPESAYLQPVQQVRYKTRWETA